MKAIIIAALGLLLLLSGCTVSVDRATSIAKEQVPAEVVARGEIITGFLPKLGPQGSWTVIFAFVNTTPNELGWEEDEITHFKPESPLSEENLPPDSYRNVVIYVDTKTGNVTSREANNELFIGGPSSFPKCGHMRLSLPGRNFR